MAQFYTLSVDWQNTEWKDMRWDGKRQGGCKRKKGNEDQWDSHFKTRFFWEEPGSWPNSPCPMGVEPEFLREFLVMLMSWEILKYSFILSRNKTFPFDSSGSPTLYLPSCGLLLCSDFYYRKSQRFKWTFVSQETTSNNFC